MQYTLGELKREARQWLLETAGAPGGDNPLLWNSLAVRATDRLCRETHCFWGARVADVVEGQRVYCPPGGIFRLTGVYFKEGTPEVSTWRRLRLTTPAKLDQSLGGDWRNADSVAVPTHAAIGGVNKVYLYPPSLADVTGGLRFEGFIAPGEAWEFSSGVAQALSDASVNPLPEWSQDALPVGMALLRCVQYPTPENQARYGPLREEYRKLRGMVEQAAAGYFGEQLVRE